jgi:hypothetical protein
MRQRTTRHGDYPQRMFSFACELSHHFRSTEVYYCEHAAQHVLLTHVLTFINDSDIFCEQFASQNPHRQNSRGLMSVLLERRVSL